MGSKKSGLKSYRIDKDTKVSYRMDGDTLRVTIVTRDAKKVIDALLEALKSD